MIPSLDLRVMLPPNPELPAPLTMDTAPAVLLPESKLKLKSPRLSPEEDSPAILACTHLLEDGSLEVRLISPPAPPEEDSAVIVTPYTVPLSPQAPLPVLKYMIPLSPLVALPVDTNTEPLISLDPALALLIPNDPELIAVPALHAILMLPPSPVLPASSTTDTALQI